MILDTAFYPNRTKDSNTKDPKLRITEDLINEVLQNITLAASSALPLGTQQVNVITLIMQPTFLFKPKLLLILPYTISLLTALVIICTAIRVIWINGSVVEDNAFIQTLTSTIGSTDTVRDVALLVQSFEDEKAVKQLRELEVRYGLVSDEALEETESDVRRRFGFGLDKEVVSVLRS